MLRPGSAGSQPEIGSCDCFKLPLAIKSSPRYRDGRAEGRWFGERRRIMQSQSQTRDPSKSIWVIRELLLSASHGRRQTAHVQ